MKRFFLCLLFLFYSNFAFALFCPTNFNQINMGDTIAEVEAKCGKPTFQKTTKSEANLPQEWTYYMMVQTDMYNYSPPDASQGTMKVTFAFAKDKVVNMTSNGIGVGATTVCNNVNLQLGSSMADVEKACGKPVSITKSEPTGNEPPPIEVTEWKYEGQRSTVLIFNNGILKERQQ